MYLTQLTSNFDIFCSWYQLDASHIVIPIMLTNECYEKKKHFGCKRLDHVQWQYWSKQNVIELFIVGWSDQLEYWHHIDCWVAPYTWYSSFRFKGPGFNSWTGPVPVHLQFEINKITTILLVTLVSNFMIIWRLWWCSLIWIMQSKRMKTDNLQHMRHWSLIKNMFFSTLFWNFS